MDFFTAKDEATVNALGESLIISEWREDHELHELFAVVTHFASESRVPVISVASHPAATVDRYEGMLMDITMGDKGSYVYINLGAFSVHEDDARRAVKIALELRTGSALQIQIGITQGILRVGVHGGKTRRTYSAMGDEVNLAARLMSTAAPGEILLSGHMYNATASRVWAGEGSKVGAVRSGACRVGTYPVGNTL